MFKLCFYVPETHLEKVKDALFETGAGKIGNYEHCCWQVLGEGQFKPLAGSEPFVGKLNDLEKVQEYKVEMMCDKEKLKQAIVALKRAHPYETPAYDLVEVVEAL